MEILAYIVLGIFAFIAIPTFGEPTWSTQDPRFGACFKRGLLKLLKYFIMGVVFLIIAWAAYTVIGV